jgi:hypothetical protein
MINDVHLFLFYPISYVVLPRSGEGGRSYRSFFES